MSTPVLLKAFDSFCQKALCGEVREVAWRTRSTVGENRLTSAYHDKEPQYLNCLSVQSPTNIFPALPACSFALETQQ